MDKKIVLVDDEPEILKTTEVFLKSEGFTVIAASDGMEALEKIKKEKPDLVILDIMLPKLDGYKVCRMLKFDQSYKDMPIIIFTARTQEADKKMARDLKADAYITKPFQPQVLLEKIKELLA